MASGLEKSTRVKLLVIFGLFIGLIIGLIIYEVHAYVKAKQQRKNFENLRQVEHKFMKVESVDDSDSADSTIAPVDTTED